MGKKNIPKWYGISKHNKQIITEYSKYRLKTLKKDEETVTGNQKAIRSLARYLKDIKLEDITEKSSKEYFTNLPISKASRDDYFTSINCFYRWLYSIPKFKRRAEFLFWYEYQTTDDKDRNSNPNKKDEEYITIEELETLINQTISPQAKAMWETLYLSGIRVCELLSMKINSLQPKENGWEITIYKSKSKPRKVALPDFPENLDYWIRHHPNKNDENKPLWISESARSYGKPLTRTNAIDEKFYRDRDRAKLKKTLTPHCFRRTRATIMLKEKSKDGGVIYTDTNMADHFGWKKQSVPQRRQEYDLTGYDDLQEKVFAKSQKPITFEKVKAEYEQKLSKLEKIKEEREKDRDELNTVKNMLNRTRNEYKILNEEIKELQRNIDEVRGTYRYILTNGNPKDDISEDDELKVLRILKILKDKEIKSKNKLLPINKKERKKRLEEILKELEELINPIIQ